VEHGPDNAPSEKGEDPVALRTASVPAETFVFHEVPLVEATAQSLEGYGRIVDSFTGAPVEIVRWPAQGWRPVDPDTGDQGGTTEGIFSFWWKGDMLHGRNDAVGDSYLLGWSRDPREASEDAVDADRSRIFVWHSNYHPDGGQLFFPRKRTPFVTPLALPGDDIRPDKFVAFYCDGSFGVYIHPGIWHVAVLPLDPVADFDDRQGRVHARVSCNFIKEFGTYLAVPLRKP
jgi:ureidoglycolate lyase